jgi:HEAT repeat protein
LTRAARSGEKSVRLAAIRVMTANPAFAPVLSELAGDADRALAKAARASLASLPGPEADVAVLAMLGSKQVDRQLAGLKLASHRGLRAAMPVVLQTTHVPDAALRAAALKAAGELGAETDLPALLALLSAPDGATDLPAAERALTTLCLRANPADGCVAILVAHLDGPPTNRCVLLRVLGAVGGPKALPAVRGAVGDSNPEVAHTAIRILAQWRSPEAAKDLLELAKSLPDAADKLLCLRGCLNLTGSEELSTPQRLALCREAHTS